MAAKKELQVSAVENGTVIDHIPAYYKRFRSCGEKSGYGARTRGGNC